MLINPKLHSVYMKTSGIIKIVLGLLLMVASLYAAIVWWLAELVNLVQGALPVAVFLVGLVILFLGFEN
jgi:hypothetical protein